MEKNKKRARRRQTAASKQARRKRAWKIWDWDIQDPSHHGQLRKNHFGCSCAWCKPWKHGIEKPLKVSERRRLQEDDSEVE